MIERIVGGDWRYFSFEDLDLLGRVNEGPSAFVGGFDSDVVIDEAHKCPELFHAIKELVDRGFDYRIILAGAANYLRMESHTESLCGRVGLVEALPFSLGEWVGRESNRLVKLVCGSETVEDLFEALSVIGDGRLPDERMLDFILRGGFPEMAAIEDARLRSEWMDDYVERIFGGEALDIGEAGDREAFESFFRGLFGWVSISGDSGLPHAAIERYLLSLETMFQVKRLAAYSVEQRKQVIKAAKIFYMDTGLLNYFVQNDSVERMVSGGDWGGVLGAHVFSELYKEIKDMAPRPGLYYWRTNNGAEVDFVLEWKQRLIPIEVKSAATVSPSSLRGLRSFRESQAEGKVPFGVVLYRGDEVVFLNNWTIGIPLGMLY